jgi:hypothetical protein
MNAIEPTTIARNTRLGMGAHSGLRVSDAAKSSKPE